MVVEEIEDLREINLHKEFRQANDPETSTDTLALLSKASSDLLRGAVALNQSTPNFILELLLNDTSEYVASCLKKREELNMTKP